MCGPAAIPIVIAAVAAVAKGYQQYQQGKFERGVAEYNARQMENDATRVRNKGVEEENKQRRFTAELQSKQKAQAGAFGVDVDVGSPFQLRQDTALLGEVDALRIRENFQQQAQTLDESAKLERARGKQAAKQGRFALFGSVLGAIGSAYGGVAGNWYTPDSSIYSTNLTGAQANANVGNIA